MPPERNAEYIERVKKFILLLRKEYSVETIKKELEKLKKEGHLNSLINYIDPYDTIPIDEDSDNYYRENSTSSSDWQYSPRETITTLTPLAIVCYKRYDNGSSKVLKLLLEYGADIKQLDKYDNDILYHICLSNDFYECLKVFFQHIAPDFYKYKTGGYRLASLKQRAALAIPKTTRNAIIKDTSDFTGTVISENIGPLVKQERLIKRLLNQKYKNNKAPHGRRVVRTPCIQLVIGHTDDAVRNAYQRTTQAVQLLLDFGADINARDKDGKTAVMDAAIILTGYWNKNYPDILKFLLSKNADINIGFGPDKITPFLATSMNDKYSGLPYNRFKATLALLEYGADINSVDNKGNTLLLRAIENKHYDLIENLIKLPLKYGLDIYIKNKEGKNAHDLANNLRNILVNTPVHINSVREQANKIKSLDLLLELPLKTEPSAPNTVRKSSKTQSSKSPPNTSRKSSQQSKTSQ